VHETLDSLPGRYGDVLEWKYIEGASMKEISERLQSTPKAVESMLSRARLAFFEAFPAGLVPGRQSVPARPRNSEEDDG
jgi:RNA polymerase sigma-70 factor (ECF subfamily)